jgi:hypothetical protein
MAAEQATADCAGDRAGSAVSHRANGQRAYTRADDRARGAMAAVTIVARVGAMIHVMAVMMVDPRVRRDRRNGADHRRGSGKRNDSSLKHVSSPELPSSPQSLSVRLGPQRWINGLQSADRSHEPFRECDEPLALKPEAGELPTGSER